jgi:repressor LexA
MTMTDSAAQARPASPSGNPRPIGRPGRKPKGGKPVLVPQAPNTPDPDHVLTWRQRKILRTIRESVANRGYPPSMLEIGEAVGLTSTSSVSYQLRTLQRKGYLRREVGGARTIEVRLPGRAGLPGIDIPSQLVGDGTLFLLQVVGDAMINAAIADGDWVVVRQQEDAQNGDIVAAMLDGQATVTAFKDADEASILGRVVAVLRQI